MRRRRPVLTLLTIAVTLLGLGIVQAPAQAAPQ